MIGSNIGSRVRTRIGHNIEPVQPPVGVQFVAAAAATFTIPLITALGNIVTPDGITVGDTMLIAASTLTVNGLPAAPPTGFTLLVALQSTATARCAVYRRIATGAELTSYDIPFQNGALVTTALMLVYRLLDGSAALVGSAIVDVVANTAYPCPSQTLVATTDLYVGLCSTFSDPATYTPPVGTTERLDAAFVVDEAQAACAFDFQPGTTGATGTLTATASNSTNGIAVSLAFKAA